LENLQWISITNILNINAFTDVKDVNRL